MSKSVFPQDYYVHHFDRLSQVTIPGHVHGFNAKLLGVDVRSYLWHEPWHAYVPLEVPHAGIAPNGDITITFACACTGFVRLTSLGRDTDA